MLRDIRFDLAQSLWHVTHWSWLGRLTARLLTADLAYLVAREEAAGREIPALTVPPYVEDLLRHLP